MKPLSSAEARVLYYLATARTERHAAALMHMTLQSVQKYRQRIYKKIGVRNRTQAATRFLYSKTGPRVI